MNVNPNEWFTTAEQDEGYGMKIEEAIKILQVAKAEIEWSAPLDYQDAIDMAIEALEKQMTKKFKMR